MQVLCVRSRVGTAALLCQRAGEEPEAPWVPAPDWCLSNSKRRGSAHVHCKLCQWRAVQTQRYDLMVASGCPYMAKYKHWVECVCVLCYQLECSLHTGVLWMNFFHPVFVNVVDYLLWKVLGTVIINLQHFTLKAIVSSLHKTSQVTYSISDILLSYIMFPTIFKPREIHYFIIR